MKPFAQLLSYEQVNPLLAGIDFRGVRLIEPEDLIEYAGRWDYGEKNAQKLGQKSKYRISVKATPESEPGSVTEVEIPIIQKYLAMGHESMIEVSHATFFIECSRVVSHELVRHRLASYQQESQRFTKYDDETANDLFFLPEEIDGDLYGAEDAQAAVKSVYGHALTVYRDLRAKGVAPQIARYIFPNATRTRLIMSANVREWRHICKLRLDKAAQPEMQQLMKQIYDQLVEIYPNAMYGVLDGERGVR